MIGKKIRLLRQQKGWGQEEMAQKLAISIPALSKIETGITDLNLSRLEQIAELFDLSLVELLGLDSLAEGPASVVEIAETHKKLMEREAEIIDLQKKIIGLLEQLRPPR